VKIEVTQGAIQEQTIDMIVVNLFEGVTEPGGATAAADQALGGQLRELVALGDFRGKLNDTALLYPSQGFPAKRVLIVGLGKQEEFDLEKVRQVSATAARKARSLGIRNYATIVHGGGAAGLDASEAAQALAEGTHLSQYRFTQHRTEKEDVDERNELETVRVVVFSAELVDTIKRGVRTGESIAAAVNWVRDLVNQPANYATPALLAEEARRMAKKTGLKFESFGPAGLRKLGMGALLGVAQGSVQEPRFVILEHNQGAGDTAPIVLVVKTIIGKTIEVSNTDAEGRLILADALGYTQRFEPAAVVDLATLTGACVVALGNVAAGLFSNSDELAAKIERASEAAHEKVWRMPLWKEYGEQIKSDVADMKNVGGRPAGAITAAMLLSKFVGEIPWAHLDIAGMAATEKDSPYQPRGASGYGVRLLVQLLRSWS